MTNERNETTSPAHQVINVEGGVPIRTWTVGVPFEALPDVAGVRPDVAAVRLPRQDLLAAARAHGATGERGAGTPGLLPGGRWTVSRGGILRSPWEARVAVLATQSMIGTEGVEHTVVRFLGGRLDQGWHDASAAAAP